MGARRHPCSVCVQAIITLIMIKEFAMALAYRFEEQTDESESIVCNGSALLLAKSESMIGPQVPVVVKNSVPDAMHFSMDSLNDMKDERIDRIFTLQEKHIGIFMISLIVHINIVLKKLGINDVDNFFAGASCGNAPLVDELRKKVQLPRETQIVAHRIETRPLLEMARTSETGVSAALLNALAKQLLSMFKQIYSFALDKKLFEPSNPQQVQGTSSSKHLSGDAQPPANATEDGESERGGSRPGVMSL
eukprot:TRINITY_DN20977_c0_g8_i1.p1 TRINITY_DN20977_c0_g8~~TRINITY_DN20977_c0_g8_i1.p1  ORF type:complete len:249 (-),score=28.90 TRINITY_DN20977_c0_g8_i1:290-1036(-)